ncbi:radical SAM protein [Sorangium sp. So ce295]|uniref:radical SAM protein n=1 Tax=Sorangium sp. So ce295 TaxID=3133295 RepID=UPI003F5F9756
MSSMVPFVAFIPLSNWLRGFDRYGMRYSKALIRESTFPDAFYMLKEDEPFAPGLEKARRLVTRLGRPKDRVVALRARLPVGPDAMRPNDVTGTGIGWRWPASEIPLSGVAWVDAQGALLPTRHEEITAEAFRLEDAGLVDWAKCRPRSISVLPVANACQARCAFCFSKASVSDLARQQSATLERYLDWAKRAKERGAERAVITGGGEPTLLEPERLRALVRGLSELFPKTLLITNGARLDLAQVERLREAGLTTLAVSRHGVTREDDARILGIEVDSGALGGAPGLRTRAICVLQRGGVDDAAKVRAYLERSAGEGFQEVCFKELYISSLSENPWAPSAANRYCEANQVPLSLVLHTLAELGFERCAELPWGSPVFEGTMRGRVLRVAAYTEPSVGWERTHGLVRSWNVMADGSCLASLEDPSSTL